MSIPIEWDVDFPEVDVVERGLSRLLLQFQDSPVLTDTLRNLSAEVQVLSSATAVTMEERTIYDGDGVQLDGIGHIIGRPRSVIEGKYAHYFGFLNTPNGVGFEEGPFWNGSDLLVETGYLDDEEYRQYLVAQIYKNHAVGGTHEDFVKVFKAIFGPATKIMSRNLGKADAKIYIGHDFAPEDRLLVKVSEKNRLLPEAATIRIEYWEWPAGGPFGFATNVLAGGFGVGGFAAQLAIL